MHWSEFPEFHIRLRTCDFIFRKKFLNLCFVLTDVLFSSFPSWGFLVERPSTGQREGGGGGGGFLETFL